MPGSTSRNTGRIFRNPAKIVPAFAWPSSRAESTRCTITWSVHQYQMPRIGDRKSTRLNSSHVRISYAVFCLKKKKKRSSYKLAGTDATNELTLQWDRSDQAIDVVD